MIKKYTRLQLTAWNKSKCQQTCTHGWRVALRVAFRVKYILKSYRSVCVVECIKQKALVCWFWDVLDFGNNLCRGLVTWLENRYPILQHYLLLDFAIKSTHATVSSYCVGMMNFIIFLIKRTDIHAPGRFKWRITTIPFVYNVAGIVKKPFASVPFSYILKRKNPSHANNFMRHFPSWNRLKAKKESSYN